MSDNRSEKDQGGSGDFTRLLLSWPGLAIMASAAALLFEGIRFQLARPAGENLAPVESPADLSVESRSWRDPFQAVLANTPSAKDSGISLDRFVSGASNAQSSIAEKLNSTDGVAMLAILVSGSPYLNGVEGRIRSRLAIQAAMRAGGFVGEDSDHLRFLIHAKTTNTVNAEVTLANRNDWAYVPFEWFETDPTVPKVDNQYKGTSENSRESGGG